MSILDIINERLVELERSRKLLLEKSGEQRVVILADPVGCRRAAEDAQRLHLEWTEIQASIGTLQFLIREFNRVNQDQN